MEELQRRDMPPIDYTVQSQGSSIAGRYPVDEILPLWEPSTPWSGNEPAGAFVSRMWPMNETEPSPVANPSATLPGVQGGLLPQVPETPLPRIPISSELFAGLIETPGYPRISVIIPTRNEAANLPYVLPHIPSIVDEVILVDGHSTDGSIEVAQRLLPGIRVIEQLGKGKGDAVRAGLEGATGDVIVMLDADGSADPREIPTFVKALMAGNDYAKGSRFAKGGGSHDITMLRSIGNYGLSRLVNVLFGTRFSDLCYGYNAFWRYCLDYVAIDSTGFEVETLINIRMHRAGLKIAEVPSFEYQRIHGASNLNTFMDGWRILKTILKEYKRKSPPAPQLLHVESTTPPVEHVLKSEEVVL